jgi:hypothetical protein
MFAADDLARRAWHKKPASIVLLYLFSALLWYWEWHIPSPGVGVAAMAVAASLMSLSGEMEGREKLAWTILLFAFLFLEITSINQDRLKQSQIFSDLLTEGRLALQQERRTFQKVVDTQKDVNSLASVNDDLRQARLAQPRTTAQTAKKEDDLKTRALELSKEILEFLVLRRNADPQLGQEGARFTGAFDGPSPENDKIPPYMKQTLNLFAARFQKRIAEIHDELATWGLRDGSLDAVYKNPAQTIIGNSDAMIAQTADAIHKLALWLPTEGLYDDVPDARLGQMAVDEADKIEALAQKYLNRMSQATTSKDVEAQRFFCWAEFKDCCKEPVAALRMAVARRLGPADFDNSEMYAFDQLMNMKQENGVQPIFNYAPYLRGWGQKLRARSQH